MQVRTFLRILLNNIFRNNIFARTIRSFVNFCCELDVMNYKSLKYNRSMSLSLEETKKNIFFQGIGGDRIDCK